MRRAKAARAAPPSKSAMTTSNTCTAPRFAREPPLCPWRARTRPVLERMEVTEVEAMKIVLFGATGNVGRRVAAEALSRGHDVVGVVRDPSAAAGFDPRV